MRRGERVRRGERIGAGRAAQVFAWGPDRVLKLFRVSSPASWLAHEEAMVQAVRRTGYPTPAVLGQATVEGRKGLVYERVQGAPMLQDLLQAMDAANIPEGLRRIEAMARTLADVHTRMHTFVGTGLPHLKDLLRPLIAAGHAGLTASLAKRAAAQLESLPDGHALCHGDFHPDNVLLPPGGPVVIDWPNASCGDPAADVARTLMMLRIPALPALPDGLDAGVVSEGRAHFASVYLERYRECSGMPLARVRAWALPVVVARLQEGVPDEREGLLQAARAAAQAMGGGPGASR